MHVSPGRVLPLPWFVYTSRFQPALIMCIFLALGPQFKSMYRHGTLAECTPKFAEFKFCLSIKMLDPEERRKAWIRRRAEWWASRRTGRSSEDVWEMRRCVSRHRRAYRMKYRQTWVNAASLCKTFLRRRCYPRIRCLKTPRCERAVCRCTSHFHVIYLLVALFHVALYAFTCAQMMSNHNVDEPCVRMKHGALAFLGRCL
jgi:hypothetical protein